jgi:protein-tyrosine phosphatase
VKILFVCLGNICRSPLAHGIAQDLSDKYNLNLQIDSAGTSSWHVGEHPCDNSIKVASNNQINISHQRSRQVTTDDFKEYDFIIGLDSSNIANLKAMGCKNAILLGDYGFDGKDVPDPYFFDGFEGFDKVFSMIETCVKNFLEQKLNTTLS